VAFQEVPVEPTDLVVLAVCVVVAPLGPAQLVSYQQHRCSDRQHVQNEEISDLSAAERFDPRIVDGAFRAAIPALIVVHTVTILFTVFFVVLLVVGNKIVERNTVVACHKIHALLRFSLLMSVKVWTA
jgi:hypothetical protein